MIGAPHVPVRLCVGCGTRAVQAALLRFSSRPDGTLALVTRQSLRGRTGYVHPEKTCWERFASRGGPLRSLRCNVDKSRRLAFVQVLKSVGHSAMVR